MSECMDNGFRERGPPQLRLVDSKPGVADTRRDDRPILPIRWPERLGWAVLGLAVLAIWIWVGIWLWGVIAT